MTKKAWAPGEFVLAGDINSNFNLLAIAQTVGTTPTGVNHYANWLTLNENVQTTGKVDALKIEHHYSGHKGGRNSLEVFSWFDGPSAAGNTDANYCGFATTFYANAADSNPTPAGFAANIQALVNPGVAWYNITGAEVNYGIMAGGSATLKSGISLAQSPVDTVQGTQFDCAISISSSHPTLGHKHGILFSFYNGYQPFKGNGIIIGTSGAGSAFHGLDFSSYTFSGYSLNMPNFIVTGAGQVRSTAYGLFGANLAGTVDLQPGRQALIGYNASGTQGDVSYVNTAPASAINSHEWYQQGAGGGLTPLGAVTPVGDWTLGNSMRTGFVKLGAGTGASEVAITYDGTATKVLITLGGTPVLSINTSNGNVRALGTITPSVTP